MATNTITEYLDDFTGEAGAERVAFSHNGQDFTIDLKGGTRANFVKMLAAFEDKMAPFLAVAKPVTPVKGKGKGRKTSAPAAKGEAAEIRQWARQNGIEVGTRGRIGPDVKAAFLAAHTA